MEIDMKIRKPYEAVICLTTLIMLAILIAAAFGSRDTEAAPAMPPEKIDLQQFGITHLATCIDAPGSHGKRLCQASASTLPPLVEGAQPMRLPRSMRVYVSVDEAFGPEELVVDIESSLATLAVVADEFDRQMLASDRCTELGAPFEIARTRGMFVIAQQPFSRDSMEVEPATPRALKFATAATVKRRFNIDFGFNNLDGRLNYVPKQFTQEPRENGMVAIRSVTRIGNCIL